MKRELVRLALGQGWPPELIARSLGISVRRVEQIRKQIREQAATVMADSRQLRELLAG
jgi:DNA-directed RNA polymerase specialized sigma24 family protein